MNWRRSGVSGKRYRCFVYPELELSRGDTARNRLAMGAAVGRLLPAVPAKSCRVRSTSSINT